eukprot:10017677-Ditylum_brightwellii.AAC.1
MDDFLPSCNSLYSIRCLFTHTPSCGLGVYFCGTRQLPCWDLYCRSSWRRADHEEDVVESLALLLSLATIVLDLVLGSGGRVDLALGEEEDDDEEGMLEQMTKAVIPYIHRGDVEDNHHVGDKSDGDHLSRIVDVVVTVGQIYDKDHFLREEEDSADMDNDHDDDGWKLLMMEEKKVDK